MRILLPLSQADFATPLRVMLKAKTGLDVEITALAEVHDTQMRCELRKRALVSTLANLCIFGREGLVEASDDALELTIVGVDYAWMRQQVAVALASHIVGSEPADSQDSQARPPAALDN